MNSAATNNRFGCGRARALALAPLLLFVATLASAGAGPSPPSFSKAFMPDTIGPGSTSMLTFTIDNTDNPGDVVEMMDFVDEFPFGMEFAAVAFVSNGCLGTVTLDEDDADSGFDVKLEDGGVGAGEVCQIVVNVTATTDCPGGDLTGSRALYECFNLSGALTSTAGSSGTASATLTVDDGRPGFSKSFGDMGMGVPIGGRTTLTFTIDNTDNAAAETVLSFTDTLPAGMVIANPANAATNCGTPPVVPTLTAAPGTDVIEFSVFGTASFPAVAAGASCTVEVDVIGGSVGSLGNVSGDLQATDGSAGKATAVLDVTGVAALLELSKEFTDDPVVPGGMVTLEFTVTNKSRTEAASAITFEDSLETTLTGLAPSGGLPTDPCGTGSSLAFAAGTLTLTGGSLAPEASCTFSVLLTVPGGATPASYANEAGPVSGDVGGLPVEGNTAGDLLFVVAPPDLVLTKVFTDDPVGAGDGVTLEFTLTNNTASSVSDIEFTDDLNSAIAGLAANGLVAAGGLDPEPLVDPCGSGSELTIFDLNKFLPSPPNPNFPPDPTMLEFTGGSLAAAGMAEDSCTFSIVVDVPAGAPAGVYTNTSSEVTGSASTTGPAASGDLVVVGAPTLSKEFIDDPVLPSGGPVTLRFTLEFEADEGPSATAIAFSDDLTALSPPVPGLTAASVDANTCGATVDITTNSSLIDVSGGTLAPGANCTIDVTLTVPADSPDGFHTNETSAVTATVGSVAVTGSPAEDDLLIARLAFSKEFTDDPVVPGQGVTLEFTFTNLGTSPADDATDIFFFDVLSSTLSGLTSTGPPSSNDCGGTEGGSASFLLYSGGSLAGGATCTVVYDLSTPGGAADGDYGNTATASAMIDGTSFSLPPAVDVLTLDSERIGISKEFTDDPVLPGGTVTLRFTLENLGDDAITDIEFTDDLGAALSGLEATSPALTNTCGGMATLPATVFSYAGGSLAPAGSPGDTCTIELLLDVPDGPLVDSPPFINTVTGLAGKVDTTLDVFGGDSSDELLVQTLTLEKSFTDEPTAAGGSVTLEFTITNLGSGAESALAFSDDLSAVLSGLTATLPPSPDPPCGAGSSLSGTSFLALAGASLAAGGSPGDSCTFSVTVTVPASAAGGSFLNTTSDLFQSGLTVAEPATDFLDIEPPPLFSKAFDPDTIFEDEVSTLIFTINNSASALAATGLDFTDTLPVGVVVATPLVKSTDCVGGMVDATAGGGTISYGGGEVAAGVSCTVEVEVTSATAAVYVNTTGDLTSSSGNSGPASDTLTVESSDADLELAKSDIFEPVLAGRFQIYTLTVTNLGPATAKAVIIEDVLPAGTALVLAEPTAACSEAGGIVTCAVGDLALSEAATVVITLYVVPSAIPAPIDNLATVTSDNSDPVPVNNDVMESTEVLRFTGLAMLDDVDENLFPEAAVPMELALGDGILVLVKDAFLKNILHMTEVFPDGWALTGFEKKPGVGAAKDGVAVMAVNLTTESTEVRVISGPTGALLSTAVVPAGYLPVTMTLIPDDGGIPSRSLIVTASIALGYGPDGRGKVHVFDCSDGSLVSEFFLHPGAVPMGLAAVDSFAGDALSELGILWINETNGGKRLQVKELSGTQLLTRNLPIEMTPLALERVADCCLGAVDELAAVGWDQASDKARLWVTQADGGGLISDGLFASKAQPIALRSVPDVGATMADELVTLFRNANDFAAVRGRDAMNQVNVLSKGYGMGSSVPLGLGVSADAYDSIADEVAVFWLDPATGRRRVTLRDTGSGLVVETVLMQVVP